MIVLKKTTEFYSFMQNSITTVVLAFSDRKRNREEIYSDAYQIIIQEKITHLDFNIANTKSNLTKFPHVHAYSPHGTARLIHARLKF